MFNIFFKEYLKYYMKKYIKYIIADLHVFILYD
jgi:hypothetical protein